MKILNNFKLKISMFIVALLFLGVAIFTGFSTQTAFAVSEPQISNQHNYLNVSTSTNPYFDDKGYNFTIEDNATLTIKKTLTIDDFGLSMQIDKTNVEKVSLQIKSSSFYVNGNKQNDKFVKDIVNVLDIIVNGDNLSYYFNNQTTAPLSATLDGELEIALSVDGNGVLSAVIENGGIATVEDGYRIQTIGDVAPANLEFTFNLKQGVANDNAVLNSIDQKRSDASGAFKQSLATVTNGETSSFNLALPRVTFNEKMFNNNGEIVVKEGVEQDINYNIYSFFGVHTKLDLKILESDNVVVGGEPEKFCLSKPATAGQNVNLEIHCKDLNDEYKKVANYSVIVKGENDIDSAPVYVANAQAIEAYKKALSEAILEEYDGVTANVRLGETITLPSLKDLVSDQTSYGNMSYTVYYTTPVLSSSASSMSIKIDSAGDYFFYVVFKDNMGNSMERDDFIVQDDDNVVQYGVYKDFVFKFHIEDNAPISVISVAQGKGFLNTTFNASAFIIKSSGYTPKYTLYYNENVLATEDSEGWVKIPALDDITKDYNQDGWTYEQIESLKYNNSLQFTPNKIGVYKIECSVVSTSSVRSSSASAIIKVQDTPTNAIIPSTWLRDNAWSVVFLVAGTLCLIGIVALLFVKPKEVADDEE